MKIAGRAVKGFLDSPGPAITAVLVYGPDAGLVKERADTLARTAAGDTDDPFSSITLTPEDLKNDPARLADEAAALSLGGGRRIVRLQGATDGLTRHFKDFLREAIIGAFVVIEAGDLGPRSSLRKAFEAADNGAALACYADDGRSLGQVITETLQKQGVAVTLEARAYLLDNLGSDRLVTRMELEKLALFKGGAGTITLDDALQCVGDNAAMSLDAVIMAAASGDRLFLDRALARAFSEGTNAITILRAAARHLQRLHLAGALVDRGQSPDQAMKALRPPVIFLHADRFRSQLRQWSAGRLGTALGLITDAELECKTTGMPVEAVCSRALLRIAQAARARQGRAA